MAATSGGYSPAPRPTNGMAVASLVLGLLSWACLGCLAGIPGIICGHMALAQIRSSGYAEEGRGLAIAGLILGYINLAGLIFGFLIWLLLVMVGAGTAVVQSLSYPM